MSDTSREIVGVFDNVNALERAADALMSNGFDRAALSLIATETTVVKELGGRLTRVEQLEDHADTPRIAYINRDDVAIGRGALIGGLFYLGAMAGTAAVLMTGGAMLPAIAVAAAGGVGGGSLGAFLGTWLRDETAAKISDEIERGGLILWVRTHSQADDERAILIMHDHGAFDVHAHVGAEEDIEPTSPDEAYYAKRAEESRAAAARAGYTGGAVIHTALATEYDQLAKGAAADGLHAYPSGVVAVDGAVQLGGSDGSKVSLTPAAADLTSDSLLRGAREAHLQQADADQRTSKSAKTSDPSKQ